MSFFGWFGGKPKPARPTRVAKPDSARMSPPTEAELLVKARSQREPERPQDAMLSDLARDWHQSLPRSQRPTQLCKQYPRIANRLALCWGEPALAARLLDDLTIDKRHGRAGFPPRVSLELINLRLARQTPLAAAGAPTDWDKNEMAMRDRDRGR